MSTPRLPPPELAPESVSDDQIRAYLSSNPGLSDRDIAKAMDQYGVSVSQMARATGGNLEEIGNRYRQASAADAAAISPTPAPRVTDEEKVIAGIEGFRPMEVRSPEVGMPNEKRIGAYVPRIRGGEPRQPEYFLPMAALDPLSSARTTLSASSPRAYKKGGAVKKMSKGKW
jgi:hypothetical protein